MINKAALGRRRGREDKLVELACDLMRRRQLRPFHIKRCADEVLSGIVSPARVCEQIALKLRVHERRGEIPDPDQGENDGKDRKDGFHFPPSPSSGRAIARPEGRAPFQDALSRGPLLPKGEEAPLPFSL